MNPCDPVTVPFGAIMQAMMTSMQTSTQPQLQPVGGHPNLVHGHPTQAMSRQTGFPTFFLQAPQLQTISGPLSVSQLGGQPWVLPTLQTVHAHAPQPSVPRGLPAAASTRPSVSHHAVNAAASPRSVPQEMIRDKSTPVGSAPDDERVLVNALQEAKAKGLTPLQGFSGLDNVKNHTAAAWKDYFLLHVERIGPKVYSQAYAGIPAPSTSKAGDSRDARSATTSEGSEPTTRDVGTSASYRSKGGDPVDEYHDEIRIPFLPPGVKPKAPRRNPRDDNPKFTKEEKIFFIHYLKYRLRKGPAPSKEQLCSELAKQTPHHTAGSWKRHWDKACKLPNKIYIQARKRVQSDLQGRQAATRLAEPSNEEDDSGEEEEEELGDEEYEPNASKTLPSTTKKAKKNAIRKFRVKVTEEDIESMVQYIVDKRKRGEGWDHLSSILPWEEFAARPENSKRHGRAWAQIAYRRGKLIEAYIQQYEAEQIPPTGEEISDPSVAETSADPQLRMDEMEETKSTAKRPAEDEEEPGSEGSAPATQKRPKLEEPAEVVVLE